MESLATAFFIAALALVGKVLFDEWNRQHERRSIAGGLAGEISAYLSFFERRDAAAAYRKIAALPREDRRRRLAAFPQLPSGHPVFDTVAGKLGMLSAAHAHDVSRIYNIVTGMRLLLTNLSSPKFLDADDEYQKAMLENIAATIDQEVPTARSLVTALEEVAREKPFAGQLQFLLRSTSWATRRRMQ
jgi:hypothetical protein